MFYLVYQDFYRANSKFGQLLIFYLAYQDFYRANSKFGQLFMFYLVYQDLDLKLLFCCLVRKKNVCFKLRLKTRFFLL